MSDESLTFNKAAQMLCLFSKKNPFPDGENYQFNDHLRKIIRALEAIEENSENSVFTNLTLVPNSTVKDTIWFQKADPSTRSSAAPALWNMVDDTLGVLGMLCCGIPTIGFPVSAGFDGLGRLLRNTTKKAEYDRRMNEATNWKTSEIQSVGNEIKELIDEESLEADLDKVLSSIIELRSLMAEMLPDSSNPENALTGGFNKSWVATNSKSKEELLGPDYLGRVWTLVRSDPFNKLILQNNLKLNKLQEIALVERPTSAIVTISIYCSIISVVVLAIKLYAIVRLLPEEALRPNWEKSQFNFAQAVRSEWNASPPQNFVSDVTAKYCYEFLFDNLQPDEPAGWLSRLDPKTGDAAQAYQKILARLNRVSYGTGLPGNRDGYWFLPEDQSTEAHPLDNNPSTVFKEHCADNQNEVKDDAFIAGVRESFIQPYISFKTELKIKWTMHPVTLKDILNPVAAARIDIDEAAIVSLQKNYGSFVSPWGGSGGYAQVCWWSGDHEAHGFAGGMDQYLLFQSVTWIGFVLTHYASKFNFTLDTEAQMTTYTLSQDVYNSLLEVLQISKNMKDYGDKLTHPSNVISKKST